MGSDKGSSDVEGPEPAAFHPPHRPCELSPPPLMAWRSSLTFLLPDVNDPGLVGKYHRLYPVA
jgi:hypothetical protein